MTAFAPTHLITLCGTLHDYGTGDAIREATDRETNESLAQAEIDGGAGVIVVDGRNCYVEGGRSIAVALDDGSLYTRSEWENYEGADWTLDAECGLLFQGTVRDGYSYRSIGS
jgi:hypothetical protein